MNRPIARHHVLSLLTLTLLACGASSSPGAPDASSAPGGECTTRCATKAQSCGAPAARAAQECAALCPKVTTPAKLLCLESTSCSELAKLVDHTGTACDLGEPAPAGMFGDACKCEPDGTGGGDFECFGTNICSPGLHCVGLRTGGVDHGTCRGPVCCTGTAECAAVLGKQASCAAGQKCSCIHGLECVGDACTCFGGVPATEGLCYPGS